MKIIKNKIIMAIILLTVLAMLPQVYAKTSIEIKPNSSTVYTNKTISDFFDDTMAMKNQGESLEGTTADVHMATNKDWAVVSYFSNSAYGTNGAGQNTGIPTSINGQEYLSTNGNATGVMDWGKNDTYTAAVIYGYKDIIDDGETKEAYNNGKSIIENATNSKYVDLIYIEYRNLFALKIVGSQIEDWNISSPYGFRRGIFSGYIGTKSHQIKGGANDLRTFRPVFWN